MTTGASVSGFGLWLCAFVGLVVTGFIVWITEYYTATEFRPVRSIAQSSTTGHGTNVIQGLAVSMEATALPVIVICVGIIASFLIGGLFGIGVAATTMLALGRNDHCARRLWTGHRQCRRHRRDGRSAARGAAHDRRARRRRQHDQGGHQRLCHRLRRARLAGAVRRLHRGFAALLSQARRAFRIARPLCRDRALYRRACCPICSARWA